VLLNKEFFENDLNFFATDLNSTAAKFNIPLVYLKFLAKFFILFFYSIYPQMIFKYGIFEN